MNTGLKMNLIRVLGVWAPEPEEGEKGSILAGVAPELEEGEMGLILSRVALEEGSMRSSSTRGGMVSLLSRWLLGSMDEQWAMEEEEKKKKVNMWEMQICFM